MNKSTLLIFLFTLISTLGATSQFLPKSYRFNQTTKFNQGVVLFGDMIYGFSLYEDIQDMDFDQAPFGATIGAHYWFGRSFMIGGGTGVLFYHGKGVVPVFLSERFIFSFFNSSVYPYIQANHGGIFNFNDFNAGSLMFFNPSIGAMMNISTSLIASLGSGIFIQMEARGARSSFFNLNVGLQVVLNKL